MSLLNRFKLDGQIALVTGGGRGIGEGIAYGLAEAGADVVLVARRTKEIERVAENIRKIGRRALPISADIMVMSRMQEIVDEVIEKMGRIDCWVSNAGGADDRVQRTFMDLPEKQWDFQLNLNLKAVWTGAQAVSKVMKEQGSGTIINISSVVSQKPSPFNGPYAVAKSGVDNLTQTLAAELAQFGIRVNGVSPGPIPTEVFMEFFEVAENDLPALVESMAIPLGRIGSPKDIAPAVVYLASDASSWMTGQTITVAGGL